jgi:glycerol-3-phosphate dehydrogenase (NAD(P)+)
MIGLAGAGDLVATALAPQSRNRRAGELLAQGLPAAEIERQVGQAVEALESVRLLAARLERLGYPAPVTGGLARLISGELPLDDWVALVRTTVPIRAARRAPGWWRRLRSRVINGAPPASS